MSAVSYSKMAISGRNIVNKGHDKYAQIIKHRKCPCFIADNCERHDQSVPAFVSN